jgi:hypothetical protein
VFHHVVIKIRHLFLRLAACLSSTILEIGVDAERLQMQAAPTINEFW